MNETTIDKILYMLASAYPRQELTDETISVYEMTLADVNPDLLRAAALRLISRSVFFPTIAELRGAAADIALERSGVSTGLQAWEIAMNGRGADMTNAIKLAIKRTSGDLYNLRTSTTQAADRARFLEAYGEITGKMRQAVTELPEVKAVLEQPVVKMFGNGDGRSEEKMTV